MQILTNYSIGRDVQVAIDEKKSVDPVLFTLLKSLEKLDLGLIQSLEMLDAFNGKVSDDSMRIIVAKAMSGSIINQDDFIDILVESYESGVYVSGADVHDVAWKLERLTGNWHHITEDDTFWMNLYQKTFGEPVVHGRLWMENYEIAANNALMPK